LDSTFINNFCQPGVTVALSSLGCKLNQAESEDLSRQLAEAGYTIVAADQKADIYILNTCTVTHIADRKSRHWLRMARRKNPAARIIALGCYAESAARDPEMLSVVDLFLDNSAKDKLKQLLEDDLKICLPQPNHDLKPHIRTRSFIKVQDGCNNFCTYCIVPLVRGREKSLTPEQVVDEVKKRVADGYQEIVLTGTEIGRYYYQGMDLTALISRILQDADIRRLRVSSLQPMEITSSLLSLWNDRRLCRHFHVSLQSGSNSVLRRMNRHYSASDYAAAINLIRSAVPRAAITTDIIVGFPGETEAEYAESYDIVAGMQFARIHVFPYSAREGTPAARMSPQIAPRIKKQRCSHMLALAEAALQDFQRGFLGYTEEVLFEQSTGQVWSGFTDTYIKVYAISERNLANRIVPTHLVEPDGDGVKGEVSG